MGFATRSGHCRTACLGPHVRERNRPSWAYAGEKGEGQDGPWNGEGSGAGQAFLPIPKRGKFFLLSQSYFELVFKAIQIFLKF